MKFEPYLTFGGNCEEAMNYYKDILNGEFVVLMRYSDTQSPTSGDTEIGNKIMHVTLKFSDCILKASDRMDMIVKKGNAYHLSVSIDDEEKAYTIFKNLANDGRVEMPFDAVFWGGKFGSLVDKFGIQWMISFYEKTAA